MGQYRYVYQEIHPSYVLISLNGTDMEIMVTNCSAVLLRLKGEFMLKGFALTRIIRTQMNVSAVS